MALTQVKSDGIATGAVTAEQIAANAVTVDDISDGSISTAKLADDAVTADKLADTAVTAGSYTLASVTVDAQGRITAASSGTAGDADKIEEGNTSVEVVDTGSNGEMRCITEGSRRLTVYSDGKISVGPRTTTPGELLALETTTGSSLSLGHSGQGRWIVATDNANLNVSNLDGEKARIDSSGRLLVGTTTSTAGSGGDPLVQAVGTSASGNIHLGLYQFSNSADGGELNLGSSRGTSVGSFTAIQNGDPLGRIRFAGANGSNLSTPGAFITVKADGQTWASGDCPARIEFSTTGDGAQNPQERVRIDAYGSLCVGATQTDNVGGGKFVVKGGEYTSASSWRIGTNGYSALYFTNASNTGVGSITVNASSVAYNTSSDYRLKENIVPLTGAIDRLNQLQVRRFNFIAEPDTTVDGFIAHEAQAVVPEAVTGTYNEVKVWQEHETLPDGVSVGDNKLDEDGNTIPVHQGIDQAKLVPLLTAALQEAIAKIETLEARLTALETP